MLLGCCICSFSVFGGNSRVNTPLIYSPQTVRVSPWLSFRSSELYHFTPDVVCSVEDLPPFQRSKNESFLMLYALAWYRVAYLEMVQSRPHEEGSGSINVVP